MSDFVEAFKDMVNSGISRTSWEAQRQLRLRAKQGEIDSLVEQHDLLCDDLVRVALELYGQGKVSDAQLARLCSSLVELNADLERREKQLVEIKGEVYVSPASAAPVANYTPPPVVSSPPLAGPQATTCFTCNAPVRPNATYCRKCGAKLH